MEIPWNSTDYPCYNSSTQTFFNCSLYSNFRERVTASVDMLYLRDEVRLWTILLIIFPLVTVLGNLLVVVSVFKEKNLRTTTNYFICSLAVADIIVALTVMPFAIYMEVMNNRWTLSDWLCDVWVSFDVLGCTASILNLTVISLDRYIAVTLPIKYAKYKSFRRVCLMLAMTWIISIAIAAPIALGVNYSEDRKKGDCRFFNLEFIIYAPIGSFYLPAIIMLVLYWKIYRIIRLHGQITPKQMVIDSSTSATPDYAQVDNGHGSNTSSDPTSTKTIISKVLLVQKAKDDGLMLNVGGKSGELPIGSEHASGKTLAANDRVVADASLINLSTGVAEIMPNPVTQDLDKQREIRQFQINCAYSSGREESSKNRLGEEPTFAKSKSKQHLTSARTKENGADHMKCGTQNYATGMAEGRQSIISGTFNVQMRMNRRKKNKGFSRREKKVMTTLFIVLGVFLVCWLPFFTLFSFSAICIRYGLRDFPGCNIDPTYGSLFLWLGYINSFLNPIVYTIFNPDFRRAFRNRVPKCCS